MAAKIFKSFLFIFVFFFGWSLYNVFNAIGNPEDFNFYFFFGVPILVSIIIFAIEFRPNRHSKSIESPALKDLELISISKEILINYLSSREKGVLVSSKNISSKLLPIIQEEINDYNKFQQDGIKTESKFEDIEKLKFSKLEESEKNIKIKVSANYKHEYSHNGRLLYSPADINDYLPETEKSTFNLGNYFLNFEKLSPGKYSLIGITDDIIGNKYGEI